MILRMCQTISVIFRPTQAYPCQKERHDQLYLVTTPLYTDHTLISYDKAYPFLGPQQASCRSERC